MKSIELKEIELDGGNKLSYKKELETILSTPQDPSKGADIVEMRSAIRVLDALEKADGVLELEYADNALLVTRMESDSFGMVHPAIVQFVDDVSNL